MTPEIGNVMPAQEAQKIAEGFVMENPGPAITSVHSIESFSLAESLDHVTQVALGAVGEFSLGA